MAKIAVLGYGVVGSGTVEVFYKNKESLLKKLPAGLNNPDGTDIKYILDVRDFPDSPYADKFTKDFKEILDDGEVTVAAELIGGLNPAYDYVKALLLAGKSVVTSNKELVAQKGAELLKIAREKGVNFFFEASVGGGIPIIRPLHQCLSADVISEIAGILNGTTNFILTKMFRDNMRFDDALKLAQEHGYAERDPSADIDGYDTCRKICILASLAFGKQVLPDYVGVEGIRAVTREDVQYCESWGGSVKLLGYAKKAEGKTTVGVCPAFVGGNSQLAGVNDVFNAILVRGEATGDVVFYGKGAGKYPTASAVVNDIVNALKPHGEVLSLYWESADNQNPPDYSGGVSAYYTRIRGTGAKALAEKVYGEAAFLSRRDCPDGETAFITGEMSESDYRAKTDVLRKEAEVLGAIRVFGDL